MQDHPTAPAEYVKPPPNEHELLELYQQPHSARERHYGLMRQGGFATGGGSRETGAGNAR